MFLHHAASAKARVILFSRIVKIRMTLKTLEYFLRDYIYDDLEA